jgi:Fur family ferric uptake transcriptional regulator
LQLRVRIVLRYALGVAASLALPAEARMTRQRRAVLDAIAAHPGSFMVVDLYDLARRAEPRLGLATVYRTVELLRRTGSLRPLAGEGRPAYVQCHPGHHHHLVCLTCGTVEETELCAAPSEAEVRERHGFQPQAHEVDIYGTCARCGSTGEPMVPP